MICAFPIHKSNKISLPRRIARRIGASPRWSWLLWNPVIRYAERMVYQHGNLQSRIQVGIKGKDIDACRLLSVCGWGILWGFKVERDPSGYLRAVYPKDRKPGESPFIRDWKFGRIRITYRPLPENY